MTLRFITVLILLIGIKDLSAEQDSAKGQILIHLSFPYINNFHFSPVNEATKNNVGFMGYSVGLDYFYKVNRYVNFSVSQIQDFYLPVAFVDKGNEYELMSSNIFNLTNNFLVNRFSFGYGIVFSKNSWELRNLSWDENSSARKPVKKDHSVFGLSFSTYYQLTQSFYLGLIYRPTFLRANGDPVFNYEHTISIDIGWKIRLKK